MANFARRLVSGNKARFTDNELGIELDLVYVTDRVIIMGYPSEGVESLYRNPRHEVRKFLEHRHQRNYWIFNFCPINENSYPADYFRGHVSRYPFPDHHAPPLSILALAAREMDLWLSGASDRVIVLHCKAGKGRSGTLACSYLLTLEEAPQEPQMERSHGKKNWANKRAADMIAAVTVVSEDENQEEAAAAELKASPPRSAKPSADGTTLDPSSVEKTSESTQILPGDHVKINEEPSSLDIPENSHLTGSLAASQENLTLPSPSEVSRVGSATSLENVLALHSKRRMKAPSKSGQKARRGVSIPSQRRFLFYWSQVLSGAPPRGFWSQDKIPPVFVRITQVTVRMQEFTGARASAMRMVSKVLDRAKGSKVIGEGQVWISLARYDDDLVETLERWEKHTRHEANAGRRRHDSEFMARENGAQGQGIGDIFQDGSWDSGKMVRSFARLGGRDKDDITKQKEGDITVATHQLYPIPRSAWGQTTSKASKKAKDGYETEDTVSTVSVGERANIAHRTDSNSDIIVDANREIRAKLYIGQVPMGWFWFIPTFHMTPGEKATVHLKLRKKEDIDFPLGPGGWLIDVDVAMEWMPSESIEAESTLATPQVTKEADGEPSQAIASGIEVLDGGGNLREAVDAGQAAEQ